MVCAYIVWTLKDQLNPSGQALLSINNITAGFELKGESVSASTQCCEFVTGCNNNFHPCDCDFCTIDATWQVIPCDP